jgi:hypothetical protein
MVFSKIGYSYQKTEGNYILRITFSLVASIFYAGDIKAWHAT